MDIPPSKWLAMSLLITLSSNAHALRVFPSWEMIEMNIVGDQHHTLPEYPVEQAASTYRAYIPATPNERYSIQLENKRGPRVGIVLAVDGRNVISGERSELAPSERMYILAPNEKITIEGWRSSRNTTQRFFFTDSKSSYAEAWGDKSAMGVIALKAYAEEVPPPAMMQEDKASNAAVAAEAAPTARASQAGTGYGETQYSPTTTVEFKPQAQPLTQQFFKYEWKTNLCSKQIMPAHECPPTPATKPANRFWPSQDGYAPPPPR